MAPRAAPTAGCVRPPRPHSDRTHRLGCGIAAPPSASCSLTRRARARTDNTQRGQSTMKQHVRKVAVGAALVATTLTGGAIGASLMGTSSAQTTSTTTAPSSGAPAAPAGPNGGNFDPSKGGHTANGVTETLLTGSDADKAKAAALAAVPGGTIQ